MGIHGLSACGATAYYWVGYKPRGAYQIVVQSKNVEIALNDNFGGARGF